MVQSRVFQKRLFVFLSIALILFQPITNAQSDPASPDCKNSSGHCVDITKPPTAASNSLTNFPAQNHNNSADKGGLQSIGSGLKLLSVASSLASGSGDMGQVLSLAQTLNDSRGNSSAPQGTAQNNADSPSLGSMLKLLSAANSLASGSGGGMAQAFSFLQTLNTKNGSQAGSSTSQEFSQAMKTFGSASSIGNDLSAAAFGSGDIGSSMSLFKAGLGLYKMVNEMNQAAEAAAFKKRAEDRETALRQKEQRYAEKKQKAMERKSMVEAKKKFLQDRQNQVMSLIKDKSKKSPKKNFPSSVASYSHRSPKYDDRSAQLTTQFKSGPKDLAKE